jgi:zinc/manganese transport system permease protein
LFFVTQGIITILIVPVAGVLLAYGFLMIPAAIGAMFSRRWLPALLIGWATGFAACVLGVIGSYRMDSPYGPTLMLAMGVFFAVALVASTLLAGRKASASAAVAGRSGRAEMGGVR